MAGGSDTIRTADVEAAIKVEKMFRGHKGGRDPKQYTRAEVETAIIVDEKWGGHQRGMPETI